MTAIEVGALVVVHCASPREKLWGVLLRLDQVGAVVRGLDLASVEDWLRQLHSQEEHVLGPSTVFVPAHRIEKIALDESSGPFISFGERFSEASGGDIRDVLLGEGS
ncbi:MAG: hypothetical protein GXP47_10030 [Acidobacteria bacterium]|nr:hypothetical protein [Acidobacteriota bacterium]